MDTEATLGDSVAVGSSLPLRVKVFLGDILPDEVLVEGYFGLLDNHGNVRGGETVALTEVELLEPGLYRFSGKLECRFCGRYGFMVRVIPYHRQLGPVYEPGCMTWG